MEPTTDFDTDAHFVRESKIIVWKNTVILGSCFFLHYMGLIPIITVQSSLNSDKGLGTVALSISTAFSILCSMFVTTGVLSKVGSKWTMVMGNFGGIVYIVANFHPTWGTLIPASIFGGIGRSFMIVSQTTYLSKLTQWYALRIGAEVDRVSPKFFGVFFSMFYSSSILGSVASSFILGLSTFSVDADVNRTVAYDVLRTCGARYCNEDLGSSFRWTELQSFGNVTEDTLDPVTSPRRPETYRIYALCGFCLLSSLLSAVLMALFLDGLWKHGIPDGTDRPLKSRLKLAVATFARLKDPKQLLLLPLTFYNGVDNYFFNVDFTKAFITCPLGMRYIGIIIATSGAFSLASALVGGWFNTKRTRWIPVAIATLAQLIPAVVMLSWIPSPNQTILQFVFASSWGIGAGMFTVHLNAFYGIVFADNVESAMASCQVWQSMASTTLYGISHLLCIYLKIYLLMGILIAGMVGFACVEIWILFEDYKARKTQLKESTIPMMKRLSSH